MMGVMAGAVPSEAHGYDCHRKRSRCDVHPAAHLDLGTRPLMWVPHSSTDGLVPPSYPIARTFVPPPPATAISPSRVHSVAGYGGMAAKTSVKMHRARRTSRSHSRSPPRLISLESVGPRPGDRSGHMTPTHQPHDTAPPPFNRRDLDAANTLTLLMGGPASTPDKGPVTPPHASDGGHASDVPAPMPLDDDAAATADTPWQSSQPHVSHPPAMWGTTATTTPCPPLCPISSRVDHLHHHLPVPVTPPPRDARERCVQPTTPARASPSSRPRVASAAVPAASLARRWESVPLTLLAFLITTFRTRSRQETKALQLQAMLNKRRYIPPAREVLQEMRGPTYPPATPQDAEDESRFPIVRIGDTIEMKFHTKTSFDLLCHGYELEPHDQVALGFGCTLEDGEVRSLEFEVLFHSDVDDATVCLRCQHEPHVCTCGYASDLLELNRDWKAKKDPTRRLGLRSFDHGLVGVALRIPRTRRPLSDDEIMANVPERPNTWNSRLKQRSQKDPKVIVIRMTERATTADGVSTVLSVHQTYARLIAKNGGLTVKK
eukprot:m.117659 g.117659  ORF g.117659 m.117659 type:complete len:547 (+) comp10949_c0_seq1:248-1888(+)